MSGADTKHIEDAHEPLQADAADRPVTGNGGTMFWGAGPGYTGAATQQVFPAKLTETTNDRLSAPVAPFLTQHFGPRPVAQAAQQVLKVALIGTAPSSRMLAPFNDPTWQIWGCSPGNQGTLPRVDAWFEIHSNLLWPENRHYGEPYIEFLKKLPCPVYMQDSSLVPNATPYPREQMVKEFGEDFFTSSFTWMMALAIHKGAKEISLFGIDMASRDEYILQRPGFYFFRYIAEQRGIKISAPHESDIMQSPGQYGYWEATSFGRKIMARDLELKQRVGQLRQQRDGMISQITYLEGAIEDLDYFKSIWPGVARIDTKGAIENG